MWRSGAASRRSLRCPLPTQTEIFLHLAQTVAEVVAAEEAPAGAAAPPAGAHDAPSVASNAAHVDSSPPSTAPPPPGGAPSGGVAAVAAAAASAAASAAAAAVQAGRDMRAGRPLHAAAREPPDRVTPRGAAGAEADGATRSPAGGGSGGGSGGGCGGGSGGAAGGGGARKASRGGGLGGWVSRLAAPLRLGGLRDLAPPLVSMAGAVAVTRVRRGGRA